MPGRLHGLCRLQQRARMHDASLHSRNELGIGVEFLVRHRKLRRPALPRDICAAPVGTSVGGRWLCRSGSVPNGSRAGRLGPELIASADVHGQSNRLCIRIISVRIEKLLSLNLVVRDCFLTLWWRLASHERRDSCIVCAARSAERWRRSRSSSSDHLRRRTPWLG